MKNIEFDTARTIPFTVQGSTVIIGIEPVGTDKSMRVSATSSDDAISQINKKYPGRYFTFHKDFPNVLHFDPNA